MRIKLSIYILFVLSATLSAQKQEGNTSSSQNESAVILELDKTYEVVSGYRDEIIITEKLRKKILLKDQAALQAFSTLQIPVSEYDNSGDESADNIKVTVRKKSGQIIMLSNEDVFELKMSYNKNLNADAFTYLKKIAIPGLEMNDTLEYEYQTRHGDREFFIGNIALADEYPISKMNILIDVSSSLSFSYSSINSPLVFKCSGDRKETVSRIYSMQADSVSKLKDELWNYESRTNPSIRFTVEYDPEFQLSGSRQEKDLQTTIASYLFNDQEYKTNRHYIKKIKKHLHSFANSRLHPDSMAIKSWYYFRYLVINDSRPGFPRNTTNESETRISDELYCAVMLQLLREIHVPAKLICYVPRDKGDLSYAHSPWDYKKAVKIGAGKSAFILYNFSDVAAHSDVPENADGVGALCFSANKNYEKTKFRWVLTLNPTLIILPGAVYVTEASVKKIRKKEDLQKTETFKVDALSNLLNAEYFVDLNILPDYDSIIVRRINAKTGNFKTEDLANLISEGEALAEDRTQYERQNKIRKIQNASEEKYYALLDNIHKEKRRDYLIKSLDQTEVSVLKYCDFQLLSTGRLMNNQLLSYEEKYVVGNSYIKIDSNTFIITPGSITGSQLALSEDEMTRIGDVYFGFARTIENKIAFTVPEGYKARNLHDFKIHAESNSGFFTSTAKQEGNIVTIEMSKVYSQTHVKKEDWPQMASWLEAAYHFTQKKLIFSKD